MVRFLKNTVTTNLGEPLVTPLESLATLPEAMQILFFQEPKTSLQLNAALKF